MPITCRINFENNPHKIAFSGQKLHITVRLKFTEETKVRGIYIQLRGTAHVRFSIDDLNRSGHYMTNVDVLDIRKYLTGGNDRIELVPSGTHDYSFICTLPPDLPSSFTGLFGNIKYKANVVICILLWPDKKFTEKFTVFKPVNLNEFPSLQVEVSGRKIQKVCISASIPSGGYSYGQNINVEVTVNNRIHDTLNRFDICIIRHTIYRKSFESRHRKTHEVIVKRRNINDWLCGPQTYKTFPTANIRVPSMIPPTDSRTCNIIQIRYFLSVRCHYTYYGEPPDGFPSRVTSVNLPITIGTIPFGNRTSTTIVRPRMRPSAPSESVDDICSLEPMLMEPTAPVFLDDDTVSIRTYASTPPPFPDDEFDLPSYEEAVLMDQEININLHSVEDTFAQLFIESTNK